MPQSSSWRERLENNRTMLTVVSVIVIIIAMAWVVQRQISKPQIPGRTGLWFYDIGTGKLFVGPEMDYPIAEPPSGAMLAGPVPGGVRAHVYSCGDCSKESERAILYVESYVPADAAATLGVPSDGTNKTVYVIAKAEPTLRWLRLDSLDGLALRKTADTHCSGQPANECFPPAP